MDPEHKYTYLFNYTTGARAHLTGITSPISPAEQYTFNYTSANLTTPFNGAGYGKVSVLSGVTTPGLGTSHQFAYNGSAEMTQVTTPLGGTLGWGYGTNTYTATGRSYREVWSRTMSSGSMSNTWTMGNDTNSAPIVHNYWVVNDSGANASKVWWFGTSGFQTGLAAAYEERGPGGVPLAHSDYGWTADAGSNVYVGTVLKRRIRAGRRSRARAHRCWILTGTSCNRRCTTTVAEHAGAEV